MHTTQRPRVSCANTHTNTTYTVTPATLTVHIDSPRQRHFLSSCFQGSHQLDSELFSTLSMEESEKRRERLKAMRMEAARAGVNTDSESSGLASHGLSNPLIETEIASTTPVQYSSPRFDYYTDPMAAFSANRRNNFSPHVSQGYYNTPPRPNYPDMTSSLTYQNLAINSPGQRVFQAPGAHHNQSSLGSPMGVASPLGTTQGNPPSTWVGSGGNFNYSYSPNFSRGGNFTTPGFVQGDSPNVNYGRGRGNRYSSSSHSHSHYDLGHGGSRYPDSGRGRGRSLGNRLSPASGPSCRRGAGSHDSVSAELRPDLYYRKEMVEDPWKLMSPVIWKALDSDKSWLPKSISMKKARGSSEASPISISQPSLAEYLATSFNETLDEKGT